VLAATPTPSINALHAVFLSLLPRIELHGRVVFRNLKCPDQQAEAIAEMLALAWLWVVRLHRQGKNPLQFPSAIATFAARQVRSGRRLCGQDKSKDVLSPRAQQRHQFKVEPLPSSTRCTFEKRYATSHGQQTQDAFEERLRDNTQTPVPEQVAFRLDFPAWLCRRSERDRRVIDDLAAGERTMDVANRHGLTAGRVSQLRREFMADWEQFCGEDEQMPASARS
jgi:hypothetical protein